MTQQLTKPKAQELLKDLQYAKAQMGQLSTKEEHYKQALEFLIPMWDDGEQQERGCQKCGGTGMSDSGGTQPWGEQILVECDCKFKQQERGEGEWIEWGGGKRPIDSDCVVGIRYRDGEEDAGVAGHQSWRHYSEEDDIIAYRIIPEQPTNQNGER